jgi:hypothetical protein
MARKPLSELAREKGEKALGVIEEIMDDYTLEARDRLRAAEAILDRGYGKAAQAVVAIPAERAARAAAALYTDAELDNIIEGEIVRREEQEALPAPRDPLLE